MAAGSHRARPFAFPPSAPEPEGNGQPMAGGSARLLITVGHVRPTNQKPVKKFIGRTRA
ncbi:hypothetical protein [Azospirillum doebereinerae]